MSTVEYTCTVYVKEEMSIIEDTCTVYVKEEMSTVEDTCTVCVCKGRNVYYRGYLYRM